MTHPTVRLGVRHPHERSLGEVGVRPGLATVYIPFSPLTIQENHQ